MLFLRICRCSVGKLIIEILKMVEKCKINFKKRVQESPTPPGIRQKDRGAGILAVFNNLPRGCPGG